MTNNILGLIKDKGISIKKLSEGLGMDYSATHKLVTRESLGATQLDTIANVAEYLNVDIKELYTRKGEIEMREEVKALDARYEVIREKLNVAKANGDLSKLYNLRDEFDESFDEFFDDENLRKKYNDWDEEEQQPLFNESNTTLLDKLDEEDLEAYIEFYVEMIEHTEDKLSEMLEEI